MGTANIGGLHLFLSQTHQSFGGSASLEIDFYICMWYIKCSHSTSVLNRTEEQRFQKCCRELKKKYCLDDLLFLSCI